MTEQDKMFIALSEYNIGLQTYEGNFVVSLKYPDGWAVIEPSEKNIRFMRDGEQKGVYYYIVPTTDGENGLNGVFRVINETVMYNKELQEKVELLNAKIKELQDIFVENPISELKKLEFVFKGKKKKTAKSRPNASTFPGKIRFAPSIIGAWPTAVKRSRRIRCVWQRRNQRILWWRRSVSPLKKQK